MTAAKRNVAVFFGGRSAEHEVSLQSARNVLDAIDRERYTPILIGIDKDGTWRQTDEASWLLHPDDPQRIALTTSGDAVTLVCAPRGPGLIRIADGAPVGAIDVAFPVLHGSFGEDGTMQGLLELAGVPCVGSSVLGSALAMDKDVAKRLLAQAGLPIPKFLVVTAEEPSAIAFGDAQARLGIPLFIKPANQGSSVGISKVRTEAEFGAAIREAMTYDTKILIEEYMDGIELECAVLGNEHPEASIPGQVIPTHAEFYSYDAKYIDEDGADLRVPADIDPAVAEQTREMAIQAFRVCGCEGMARVDFFLRPDGRLFVNEINTIPGFTRISMYPRLWEATGVPRRELVDRLLRLAEERFQRDSRLRTRYAAPAPRPAIDAD